MSCRKYRKVMSFFLDGEDSLSEREKLYKHLNSCSSCRFYFENLKKIQEKVASLEPAEPPEGYPKIVAARVVKRIVENQKTWRPARVESFIWPKRRSWLWAVPALLMIILSIFLFHQVSKKAEIQNEAYYLDFQQSYGFLGDKIEDDEEILVALNSLIEEEIIGFDLSEIDYNSFIDYFYFSFEELSDEKKGELLKEIVMVEQENRP